MMYTVSSYTVDGDRDRIRYTVFEDTVAIFDTASEQEARSYADALNAAYARLAG